MRRATSLLLLGFLLLDTDVAETAGPGVSAVDNPATPPGAGEGLDRLLAEMLGNPAAAEREPMALYAHAFAGYALVNIGLADQTAAPRCARLLDGLIERGMAPALTRRFGPAAVHAGGHALPASVAPRGHLLLLLVGRRLLAPLSPPQQAVLDALAKGLAGDVLTSRTHLLPTYGQRTWPADNEVLAAGLALYLAQQGDAPSVRAASQALRAALLGLERGGLPPSEVRRGQGIDVPRGCALSWSVAMRGLYDPAWARQLYQRYRAQFFVRHGPVCGFREWPPGIERPGDADSGPVLLGIGVAASGIGIGAAQLAGEPDDRSALLGCARVAGLAVVESLGPGHWVERAMAAWARTARPFSVKETPHVSLGRLERR